MTDASGPTNSTLAALLEGDANRELTFEAPWQARAFGLALALRDRGLLDWEVFQSRFIEAVQAADPDRMAAHVETVYYECWLETLEALVLEADVVEPGDLDRRTAEFADGVRDASEFIIE